MPIAWVTGGAGFIGGHVIARLQKDGWKVIGIDRRPQTHVTGNIGQQSLGDAYAMGGPPSLVFHAAGTSSVGESLTDPAGSERDTVGSTTALLEFLIAKAPGCRVVYPSSAAVYGATENIALQEDRVPNPISPYGRHKLAAEKACLAAAEKGLKVAVVRFFSVYGPGLRKQLPWDLGTKLLAKPEAVRLGGTGAETRDFLEAADVAELVHFLGTADLPAALVVNGGTGIATRVDVFAKTLAEMLSTRTRIAFSGESRAGDPRYYRADTARLLSLGFRPKVSLLAGLTAYAGWLRTEAT